MPEPIGAEVQEVWSALLQVNGVMWASLSALTPAAPVPNWWDQFLAPGVGASNLTSGFFLLKGKRLLIAPNMEGANAGLRVKLGVSRDPLTPENVLGTTYIFVLVKNVRTGQDENDMAPAGQVYEYTIQPGDVRAKLFLLNYESGTGNVKTLLL